MLKKTQSFHTGQSLPLAQVLNDLPYNADGLIPAIAQQYNSRQVLMLAWMNQQSIEMTLASGQVHYFSRSRQQIWRKGERSAQTQSLKEMRIDCDGDTILLLVDQTGPACHTGRVSCFYNLIKDDQVIVDQDPIIDPKTLYEK